MTFKEKLIILRKKKGLTQGEFAKEIGVSRQCVYKWEAGQSYPEVQKLLEIKALLEISLDDLFDDSYEIAVPEKKRRKKELVTEKITPPETADEEIKEETSPAGEKSEKAPEKAEETEPSEEKKVGFFGRLFGRK